MNQRSAIALVLSLGVLAIPLGVSASGRPEVATSLATATTYSPAGGWDYEYLFVPPDSESSLDMAYGSTCSSSDTIYKMGVWDANNGFSGAILDVGDPIGFLSLKTSTGSYFFPSQSTGDVKAFLNSMTSCFVQGWDSTGSSYGPILYLSFSNDVGSANYTSAGQYAGEWVSGVADFSGAWVDFEGGYASEANSLDEYVGYRDYETGGTWWDSGWFGESWTYTQAYDYITSVDQGFYESLFINPQNYYLNMTSCSGSYPDYPLGSSSGCTAESPWVGSYVQGVTVEKSSNTVQQQYNNYEADGYPDISQTYPVIVGAYLNDIPWNTL